MATSPTPAERSIRGLTILSAISVSSRTDMLPASAIDMVGEESALDLATKGSSAWSGSSRITGPMRSRTSCTACGTFVDSRNSANTSLRPSREFEKIRLMPDT